MSDAFSSVLGVARGTGQKPFYPTTPDELIQADSVVVILKEGTRPSFFTEPIPSENRNMKYLEFRMVHVDDDMTYHDVILELALEDHPDAEIRKQQVAMFSVITGFKYDQVDSDGDLDPYYQIFLNQKWNVKLEKDPIGRLNVVKIFSRA